MSTIEVEESLETSRARRLKAATSGQHDCLDEEIMAQNPFASRESYGRFVNVQHEFHRAIERLYSNPELVRLLPDLPDRLRFGLIAQDLNDLGIVPIGVRDEAEFGGYDAAIDVPTALGWLYVAEGSNLGAAFLLKAAGKLGLSESFGARHLAAAPEGRASHWKTFTAALDAVNLSDVEEQRVLAGASAAFSCVKNLVQFARASGGKMTMNTSSHACPQDDAAMTSLPGAFLRKRTGKPPASKTDPTEDLASQRCASAESGRRAGASRDLGRRTSREYEREWTFGGT